MTVKRFFREKGVRVRLEPANQKMEPILVGFDREAFVVVPLSHVGDVRGDFDCPVARLRPVGGSCRRR